MGHDMMVAAHEGDVQQLRRLVAAGADVNYEWHTEQVLCCPVQTVDRSTLRHAYRARYNHTWGLEQWCVSQADGTMMMVTPIIATIELNRPIALACLLEANADANKTDSLGRTPLHWVADRGSDLMCPAVIASGTGFLLGKPLRRWPRRLDLPRQVGIPTCRTVKATLHFTLLHTDSRPQCYEASIA